MPIFLSELCKGEEAMNGVRLIKLKLNAAFE